MKVPRQLTVVDRLQKASRPRVPVVATPLGSGGALAQEGLGILIGESAERGMAFAHYAWLLEGGEDLPDEEADENDFLVMMTTGGELAVGIYIRRSGEWVRL